MPASDAETNKKYEIEDLPKFFEDKSEDISTAFSDGPINISTICCGKPKDKRGKKIKGIQEISFKLELLTTTDKDIRKTTLVRVKSLIKFFKACLHENKNFTAHIEVKKASEELYKKYRDTKVHKDNTVEGFISNVPHQILLEPV